MLMLAALIVPASARAADAGDAPIVVTAARARAVISRHPFRLQVQDGTGRLAVQEVAAPASTVQTELPTADPIAPGVDNQHTTTLYAPLSFTVGSETVLQYPADEFEGNLLSGVRSGVQYAAADVLSATPQGAGVHLVLSTSDPSGRRLLVDVAPQGQAAIRVTATLDRPDGVSGLGDSFASTADEAFFGFGGRHNALDQRGEVLSSFVQEENYAAKAGPADLGPLGLALIPNGATAAYYPQPLLVSSKPYGFLLHTPELARFKLDADRPDAWNVTASAPRLDYVVAPGDARTAIGTLTGISGRQPVPPQWGLGPMLDRAVRQTTEDEDHYEGELRDDLAHIDGDGLPLTAYRIEGSYLSGDNDGLSLHTYTSPAAQAKMVAELKRRGIHPLFYLRPWLVLDSAPVQRGFAVRDANGAPAVVAVSGQRRVNLIDFTNPEAVRWWAGEVDKVLDLGFDGFMQDYGEHVLFDMRFADGSTGAEMHNRYLVDYSRATHEAVEAYEARHPGRSSFVFTRAGYTGQPGSAAYENANFPGDETTDWGQASGLASLAPDMLNRAVGGAYGFATDIGGYADITTPATTRELFVRWAEWAALSPVFRLHGSAFAGTHTPWSYGPETLETYKALSRLHLAAAPYIRRAWQQAARTGVPVTRPLWLADPGDRAGYGEEQEWLLGDDVLVAPVVEEGALARDVHVPSGRWVSPTTGQSVTGPATVRVDAPLDRLPFFFRAGTQPFPVDASAGLGLPDARACVSRRRFAIRLQGAHLRSATVSVAGRRVRVRRRGHRLVAVVDLRGRPPGTFTVRIVARTRAGTRLRATRTYRTCRRR